VDRGPGLPPGPWGTAAGRCRAGDASTQDVPWGAGDWSNSGTSPQKAQGADAAPGTGTCAAQGVPASARNRTSCRTSYTRWGTRSSPTRFSSSFCLTRAPLCNRHFDAAWFLIKEGLDVVTPPPQHPSPPAFSQCFPTHTAPLLPDFLRLETGSWLLPLWKE